MSEYVEQVRKRLGELARQQMETTGGSFRSVGEAMGAEPKTFHYFTTAKSRPHPRTLNKIEAAIGWRRGVITEVLEGAAQGRVDDKLTLDYMRGEAPAERASQLSDEELLAEVAVRIKGWQAKLTDLAIDTRVPPRKTLAVEDAWDQFGLAALKRPGTKPTRKPGNGES